MVWLPKTGIGRIKLVPFASHLLALVHTLLSSLSNHRCPTIMDHPADQWHSIRPWIHRFALSVDQVSSVSATFTLTSALDEKPLDPALESLLEDERDDAARAPTEHPEPPTRSPAVSDALTNGLSVKVNSSPWQRVLLRVEEESDEAIIIVFGLMPGRQYDIELGIPHRHEHLRSLITTNNTCEFFPPPSRVFLMKSPVERYSIQRLIGATPIPIRLHTIIITRTDLPPCQLSCLRLTRQPHTSPSPSLRPQVPPHPRPPLPRCPRQLLEMVPPPCRPRQSHLRTRSNN